MLQTAAWQWSLVGELPDSQDSCGSPRPGLDWLAASALRSAAVWLLPELQNVAEALQPRVHQPLPVH